MNYKKYVYILLALCASLHAVCADLTEEEIKTLSSKPGHLKPLGSSGPFFELYSYEGFPKPREFFNKYVIPSTPVVMRNAAKLSPAFTKWSDEYFINHPESEKQMIFAEGSKKEIRTEPGSQMSFKNFVETYNESDIYMVNALPMHLRSDVRLPLSLQCEPVLEALVDLVSWFSSGGTKSVLHNDDVDNINCLFRGNKTLIFINPHDKPEIWEKIIDHPEGSYSSLDVDAVDYTLFPDLADVRYARLDMQAGDCLYIPYRWYHQVNSFGSNLAVNLWWNHFTEPFLDLTDEICGDFTDRDTLANLSFSGMLDAYGHLVNENSNETSTENNSVQAEESKGQETPVEVKTEGEPDEVDKQFEELISTEEEEEDAEEEEQEPQQEESLADRIYKAILKVKKPVLIGGLKKYTMKKFPSNIQSWDEKCDEILNNFYETLDHTKDKVINEDDAEIHFNLENHERDKFADASAIFEEDLMVAMREATTQKEMILVQKLLDRGELDREQIATIFGNKIIMPVVQKDEL